MAATNIIDIVDLIHPTASGIGVITTDQVWILFDREIDENSITAGNFFVAGPDFDTWSGPDFELYQDYESTGDESEILHSPGYEGIVGGSFSFQRISLTSYDVISGIDIIGSGLLYRTKAIFTPEHRLAPNTTYKAYLSGDEDETDVLKTGISERTVFDTVASGTNTGTGSAEFEGSYTGTLLNDIFYVKISTAGELGEARFQYWRHSVPSSIFGPFKTKESGVFLADGVTVNFSEGSYEVDDTWSAVIKRRNIFLGNLMWPFETGAGDIEEIPTTTSTSIIGTPYTPTEAASSTGLTPFSVETTFPLDYATNVAIPAGPFEITVDFNKNIDPFTVISGVSVTVFTDPVNGDPAIPVSGLCVSDVSVAGDILTITVASGYLLQNNWVTVTLEDTIGATDTSTLGSDYTFGFSTAYYPLYCTVRKMRLEIGAFIEDLNDDTINFAIFSASLEADHLTWNQDNLNDAYYQFVRSQWTCCRAQEILLLNMEGGRNRLKSKRLGDLEVQYNPSDMSSALSRAVGCLDKWESSLHAGGASVQTAQYVVKGEYDLDRPAVGRGWEKTYNSQPGMPIGNSKTIYPWSRRYKKTYSRNPWSKDD